VFFEELRQATDRFRMDQQRQLEQFHARMEGLLVRQQTQFERSTAEMLSETTYTFDRNLDAQLPDYAPGTPSHMKASDIGRSPSNLGRAAEEVINSIRSRNSNALSTAATREVRVSLEDRRFLRCDFLRYIVRHRWFALFVNLVICLNAVYIGIVTNNHTVTTIERYNSLEEKGSFVLEVSWWEPGVDFCFTALLLAEIVVRILGEEFAFFLGKEWAWNCMDVLIVMISFTQAGNPSFKLVRLIRIFRVLHGIHLFTQLSLVSKFRMLLLATQHALMTLTCVSVLLAVMLYTASLVFLNAVTGYLLSGETETETVDVLQSYLGALDQACLTLFMSISGGLSWELIVKALLQVNTAYGLLFVLFIASMMLAALNVCAGIFVNDAIELAQQDRDVFLQMEAAVKNAMMRELRQMFLECDTNGDGTLTREEFMEAWENPNVMIHFRHIGVELEDAKSLFEMMDIAEHDELHIDDFVDVCLRAKTLMRPVDLQSYIKQNKRNTDALKRAVSLLQHEIGSLGSRAAVASGGTPQSLSLGQILPRNRRRLTTMNSVVSTPKSVRSP